MTPFEQAAMREYGHASVCLVAHDRKALPLIVPGMHGRSHFPVHGQMYGMDTKRDGLHLRPRDGGETRTVRWVDVLEHVRALADDVRALARAVDHDAHRPPASGLEWHSPYQPEPRTEAQRLAHSLWADHVRTREADVLEHAFPDVLVVEELDLFSAVGL